MIVSPAQINTSIESQYLLCDSLFNAQVFYTEATSGDLGDPVDSSPSILGLLGLGLNTVNGSLDNTATILDRDAFTFTVASGQQLDSLSFTSLTGDAHFFALSNQNAPVSTFSASGNYYTSLIDSGNIGVNLLDGTINIFQSGPSPSGPLGPGGYTFWFQETDGSVVPYGLSLTTSSVPEPSAVLGLLVAGGLMCLRRRIY